MHRREYFLTAIAAISVAGCLRVDSEPDGPGNDTGDNGSGENGDNQGAGGGDDDDNGEPAEHVTDVAVHHWPFVERSGNTVEDIIGDANGTIHDGLENINGEWYEDHAEYLEEGAEGHIDLGHLESINEAVAGHAFALIATVKPSTITPDRAMTILGAGGGHTNWCEFRISESDGTRNGRPIIMIRDNGANEIRVAAGESIAPDTTSRIAVSMEGNTADDVTFWINGEKVYTEVLHEGELVDSVVPEETYGIFASNPDSESTIRTRRWFRGTIDNVIFCDQAISDEAATQDFEDQPWSEEESVSDSSPLVP